VYCAYHHKLIVMFVLILVVRLSSNFDRLVDYGACALAADGLAAAFSMTSDALVFNHRGSEM
jgi:hypothetical protein